MQCGIEVNVKSGHDQYESVLHTLVFLFEGENVGVNVGL